jgi:molybdate transport system substrate-binding protein
LCTNELVLVTPASNPANVKSLQDLASKPLKLVIGSATVPVGFYTRIALTRLNSVYGAGYSDSVLREVVSNEDSATSIITKVDLGEADAGFVYLTDALGASPRVNLIRLPAYAGAAGTYPIAAVRASQHLAVAEQFVAFALTAPARYLLTVAGFGRPSAS